MLPHFEHVLNGYSNLSLFHRNFTSTHFKYKEENNELIPIPHCFKKIISNDEYAIGLNSFFFVFIFYILLLFLFLFLFKKKDDGSVFICVNEYGAYEKFTHFTKVHFFRRKGIIDIFSGLTHTLLLSKENKIYRIGGNFDGQLGLGDYVDRYDI